jgi:hypothetical protein
MSWSKLRASDAASATRSMMVIGIDGLTASPKNERS